jgi:ribosome-associated translation inhibitor RaiA
VTIEATGNRHHQGHEYQVHIDVHVPGGEVVVSQHHRGADAQLAVRAAFDAMDRLLRERIEHRRKPAKRGAAAKEVGSS